MHTSLQTYAFSLNPLISRPLYFVARLYVLASAVRCLQSPRRHRSLALGQLSRGQYPALVCSLILVFSDMPPVAATNQTSLHSFSLACLTAQRRTFTTSLICSSCLRSGFRGSLSPIFTSPRSLLLNGYRGRYQLWICVT